MARGFVGLLILAALAGCGDGRQTPCTGADCNTGSGPARCHTDTDCGDGRCQPDGTCSVPPTQTQPTACANVTCPANFFCANGQCLPAVPQCKPADPTCIFIPQGAFEPPAHAWWWPFPTPLGPDDPKWDGKARPEVQYPAFAQVMSTPVVIRLHPSDPEPAVVFNAFSLFTAQSADVEMLGLMRAIRGSDGSTLWTAPKDFPQFDHVVNAVSSIAAGDCKGDGHVCFVTGGWNPDDNKPPNAHQHGGLIAFDENGDFLWANRGNPATGEPGASLWWGGPAIARLLPDSKSAQVVVGNGVYDAATGKTLCPQSAPPNDQISGNGIGSLSIVADIDLDGVPEILTGNNAYKLQKDPASPTGYTCKPVFGAGIRMSSKPPSCPYGATADGKRCNCPNGFEDLCPDGFPAVANFAGYGAAMGLKPDDKHPQIAVVSKGLLRIQDWTGGMVLSPIPLPASSDPECAVEANVGGAPTIADFDGDGLPEIGIAAQGGYVVWKPGAGFIWKTKTFDCSAATGSSVFDFEGKGRANVVYSDPVQLSKSPYMGLKALASPSDKWVNTRSVWNQHSYHVSNVNLDGTLPFPEPNSWDPGQSNSYRQNVQGKGVFSSPDLSVCEVVPDLTNCRTGQATVSATVYNGGAQLARPGVQVQFFADTPSGSFLIGSGATKSTLQPGASEKVTVPWPAPPLNQAVPVRAVVDPNQLVGDCHLDNNTAKSAPVKCSPIG